MSESEMVPEPVRKAVEKLAQPTPMRRGSLGQRFLRCGRPNCRCATHEDARHGPYFNLTRTVGGRTRSRRLSAQQAERARLQVAAGREFRQQVEAYLGGLRAMGRRRAGGGRGGERRYGRKKGLQAIFEAEVAAEVEALISPEAVEALDFEALEMTVRQRALELAARAVERRLNADLSDHVGANAPCTCGQTARYAGRRAKHFQTVLGAMRLERAYYDCPHCKRGFCPRDRTLGLEGRSLSPAVTRMVGTVGALVSFQEGSELLSELAGVEVGAKQVERTAEALGREIAQHEQQVVEPANSSEIPETLYLGVDGTGVPMRRCELVGRAGKQPDGSAKTREVKLCTLWSAQGRDEEDRPVRDRGSVSYSAAIETAATQDVDSTVAPFWQRVEREAKRRGFDRARRQVFPRRWGTVDLESRRRALSQSDPDRRPLPRHGAPQRGGAGDLWSLQRPRHRLGSAAL